MPSNYLGKIQVTPSMLKRHETKIEVHAPRVRVTLSPRVWLGLRLIWLGAFIADMGYRRQDGEE